MSPVDLSGYPGRTHKLRGYVVDAAFACILVSTVDDAGVCKASVDTLRSAFLYGSSASLVGEWGKISEELLCCWHYQWANLRLVYVLVLASTIFSGIRSAR